MIDNKKEQERAELHRTIWCIANDLRGSVDGWDFKHYVLGILFYRYASENITAYINKGEWETGDKSFNYADLSDSDAEQARVDLVKTKGLFDDIDVNSNRLGGTIANRNKSLVNLMSGVNSMKLGDDQDNTIDAFGDANPLLINDPRFPSAGILAPKSKADLVFIMHRLSWLATNGTAVIVCFLGVMYRSGAEMKIRKSLRK